MIDPRKQVFSPYLRRLADALALKDWRVEIKECPAGEDATATVLLTYGRKWAEICLAEAFLDQKPADQRRDLVHELIHCHLEPAWEAGIDGLPEPAHETFVRLMEYAIDGIADGIAPHLPLPDEPRMLVVIESPGPPKVGAPTGRKVSPGTARRRRRNP